MQYWTKTLLIFKNLSDKPHYNQQSVAANWGLTSKLQLHFANLLRSPGGQILNRQRFLLRSQCAGYDFVQNKNIGTFKQQHRADGILIPQLRQRLHVSSYLGSLYKFEGMERQLIEEKKFENLDFAVNKLPEGDYENCRFSICSFLNADISNINFTECEFNGCNFSLTLMTNTMLRNIKFVNCKLLGVHFDKCKELNFKVYFEGCIINISSFYRMKLKNTKFIDSIMQEVDLVDCDLSNVIFHNCDLFGAVFENTILENADFRTAYNYTIDPDKNLIKKAKFSLIGIPGLLNKYDINIE